MRPRLILGLLRRVPLPGQGLRRMRPRLTLRPNRRGSPPRRGLGRRRPRLILRLPAEPEAPLEWVTLDTRGQPEGVSRRGTPSEAAAEAEGRQVLGLADGLAVLLTDTVIPSRNRERLRQAVPFALEDRLAAEVDSLHFVLGSREPGSRLRVAVFERSWLAGWQQALADAGVVVEQIYPEILALPRPTDAWTVLLDGDRFLVRTGKEAGFSGDADNWVTLLEAALAEAGEAAPDRLVVYRTVPSAPPLPDSTPPVEHHTVDESLAHLAAHLEPARALSLGAGAGAAGGAGGEGLALWRRWQLPAALALALLALATSRAWLQQWELAQRSERLQARIEATFHRAFPDIPVEAPRIQMKNRLAALRAGGPGGGGFLSLLNLVAPAIAAVADARVTALSYRAESLELEVATSSLQRIRALEQRLAAAGNLSVEVAGAQTEGERVRARLLVEASP